MDFDPTQDQNQLIDAFNALYAKWSTPDLVRRAEAVGFDPELWDQLGQIGAIEMAVPESSGGAGASLLDLELVSEQHGRWLASVPMIESQVAARLLARLGGSAASELLESVIEGKRIVTIGLHRVRNGMLKLVPGGAVADAVVALDGDRLVAIPVTGSQAIKDNLGDLPLADIPVPDSAIALAAS